MLQELLEEAPEVEEELLRVGAESRGVPLDGDGEPFGDCGDDFPDGGVFGLYQSDEILRLGAFWSFNGEFIGQLVQVAQSNLFAAIKLERFEELAEPV